jgi:hypothetical protein
MKTGAKLLVVILSVVTLVAGAVSTVQAAPNGVTINEFAANPGEGDTDWVELHNSTASAVSLAGWYLRDTAASNMKTFTATDEIPAGGFFVTQVSSRLGNINDTISLFSPSGLEDSVIYPDNVAVPAIGQSAGRSVDGAGAWTVFALPTKGASNNAVVEPDPEYGEVRVHAVKEINDDGHPNFNAGEPHQAGIPVRVYAVQGGVWTLADSGNTTGQYFNKSLRFTLETGTYAVCMPEIADYEQSFARSITGWLSFPDTSTANLSGEADEYGSCVSVLVGTNAITSHVFGLRATPVTQ